MALDIVAIITAVAGKEKEAEQLLNDLANGVKDNEPNTPRYKPYKRIDEDGNSEYVMIERLAFPHPLFTHWRVAPRLRM